MHDIHVRMPAFLEVRAVFVQYPVGPGAMNAMWLVAHFAGVHCWLPAIVFKAIDDHPILAIFERDTRLCRPAPRSNEVGGIQVFSPIALIVDPQVRYVGHQFILIEVEILDPCLALQKIIHAAC